MSKGEMVITAQSPEIIAELINKAKSDELRYFFYEQDGSGSSGQRYNHGFYGHLFALLSSEKPIATYFFTYDNRNRFVFNREEKSLHLHFFDLVGNFKIDWEESRWILENVKKIEEK